MEFVVANIENIDNWMNLVEKIKDNFPGLNTSEQLENHKQKVLEFMRRKEAICIKDNEVIVAICLFLKKHNMICFLGVCEEYRRQGLAAKLLEYAISELDNTKDITVSTFRKSDPKGTAPRNLYKKYGFIEGALTIEFDYPNQQFILKARKNNSL